MIVLVASILLPFSRDKTVGQAPPTNLMGADGNTVNNIVPTGVTCSQSFI